MANKAFGFWAGVQTSGSTVSFQFTYTVINPGGSLVGGTNSSSVTIAYGDSPYAIWSNLVAQCRTDQSDSSLIVVPLPSSLDYLMYGRTY